MSFVRSVTSATVAVVLCAGSAFAGVPANSRSMAIAAPPPTVQTKITKATQCAAVPKYVPGHGGTLGYYVNPCTGQFLYPAVK